MFPEIALDIELKDAKYERVKGADSTPF